MDIPDRVESARRQLFRAYCITAAPPALLFAAWALLGGDITLDAPMSLAIIGPVGFVGAIVFAVALPILLRAKFVQKYEHEMSVPFEVFLVFQKTLQSVALTGAYFAAAAYVFQVSKFHFAGAFLAALYGAYYYFPSTRRVAYEMRLFRVDEEE